MRKISKNEKLVKSKKVNRHFQKATETHQGKEIKKAVHKRRWDDRNYKSTK